MDHKSGIYIASLFHDIGKFWQRAASLKTQHQYLSMLFVSERMQNNSISIYTRYHHQKDLDAAILNKTISGKDALFAQIVCLADSIASMERSWYESIKDESGQKRMPLEQKTAWSLKAQESIFNKIHLHFNTDRVKTNYQPICHLTPDKYEYVHEDIKYQTRPLFTEGYEVFWDQFNEEISQELKKESGGNLTAIYYLLKKYLWCIPSSYFLHHPDISLFEHSRLTAAIAVCMYDFWEQKTKNVWEGIKPTDIKQNKEEQFLLVTADLSGIQDFLYNIAHMGALKALKGRSYFLQHLMDAIARKILERLDLFEANMIYSSGGKFYLLLPNLPQTRKILSEVKEEINQFLLRKYHGEIAVIFAEKSLAIIDFRPGEISERWDELSQELERNKLRRFSSQMTTNYFKPDEIPYGRVKLCWATSTELAANSFFEKQDRHKKPLREKGLFFNQIKHDDKYFYEFTEEIDEEIIDTGNWIQEEQYESQIIGQKLKGLKGERSIVSIIYNEIEDAIQKDKPINFLDWESFDVDYRIRFPKAPKLAYLLNDDDFSELPADARGWKFYAGNWHPMQGDEAADFSDLAKGSTGIKRLAVLRMDVDNLGLVFKEGINDGKPDEKGRTRSIAPFSRIVQLSNMLDFFFSGYLNKLYCLYWSPDEGVHSSCELKGELIRNGIQIIYAGGDDLNIVGKWNMIPDIALWIQEQFQKFTGFNPDMGISAGIALFSEKYPLFKVAEIAGDAEARAKRNPGKNAITFLDHTCNWENYREISDLAKKLYLWLEEGIESPDGGKKVKLPSSFLHMIQELYGLFSKGMPLHRLDGDAIEMNRYGRWRWLGAYRLHRFGQHHKAYSAVMQDFSIRLFTNVSISSETDFLLILYTATQWADFLTRKKDGDGE